jgi:Mrp family chromosome partitioning ATPase
MLDLVPTKWIKSPNAAPAPARKMPEPAAPAWDRRARVDGDLGPLRMEDMVGLYRSIKQALPDRPRQIVEVIAANHGEGVSTIARGLAQAAALMGNARTLICDASPERANFRYFKLSPPQDTLNDLALKTATLADVLVDVPRPGISLCALSDPGSGNRVAVNVDLLDPVLAMLRERFDLIVIDAPPTNHSVLGAALAKKADGVVLVIEAERTRTPIAAAALQSIQINNGKTLGVVLNKRRFHIPRFVYRWI